MRPSVETEEEYRTSKCLLLHFLRSRSVVQKVVGGKEVLESLIDFLNGRIFIHEKYYCHYLKKGHVHLNIYTNNGVEGLQNGVRHSIHKETAQTSLPLATKKIVDGELNANSRKKFEMRRNAKTTPHLQEYHDQVAIPSTIP